MHIGTKHRELQDARQSRLELGIDLDGTLNTGTGTASDPLVVRHDELPVRGEENVEHEFVVSKPTTYMCVPSPFFLSLSIDCPR